MTGKVALRGLVSGVLLGLLSWPALAATPPEPVPDATQLDAQALRQRYQQPAATWPTPWVDGGVVWQELGPLPAARFPTDNPRSAARAKLGMQLFFDPRLSRSGEIACASCHDSDLNWADGRRVSFGEGRQSGGRNAPSLTNASQWQVLFWDGRATSLEQQALMSLADPREMATPPALAVAQLQRIAGYGPAFAAAFGSEQINAERISQAIATWVRTLTGRRSDFERFLAGRADALSDQAVIGLHLFRTRARCLNCHHGALMTDQQFHNLGLHWAGRAREDWGRYGVTGKAEDKGAFRTPSLRDVAQTGPWMHNGLFPTLGGILNLYNAGGVASGEDTGAPPLSLLLKPLDLSAADREALEAFLHSISGPAWRASPPSLP